jgi:DNA-binding NarL/FixJ family response regulator
VGFVKGYIDQALKAGARGYVVRDPGAENLIAAINSVRNGGYYLDSPIADQILSDYLGAQQKECSTHNRIPSQSGKRRCSGSWLKVTPTRRLPISYVSVEKR